VLTLDSGIKNRDLAFTSDIHLGIELELLQRKSCCRGKVAAGGVKVNIYIKNNL
jgi:hypothetical protein